MAALLGKPCGFACREFDACLSSCCALLFPPDAPSPVFLIYTLVLAGLPLLFAIPALISSSSSSIPSECDSKPVFLNILFFMLFQLFAVLFSFYLYRRFARPYNYSDPQDNDPCARAGRLFCHDPFVAVALVVVPVFFVYSIVALNTNVPSTCPSNVKGAATGWLPGIVLMYIMLSGAIIGLSLCCMSCSQTTTGTHATYGHHYPATMRGYGNNNNNNNSSNIGNNSRFVLFGPVGGVLSYLFVPPQRQQPPTTMRQSTAPPMHVPPPVVPAPQYPQPRAPPAQPTMYAGGGYGAPPPPPPHPPQQQQPTAPVTGYPVGHGGGGYAPSAPSASSFPATGGGQPYSSAPPPQPPQQQQPSAAAQIAGAAASGIASMAAAGLRTAAAGLERASQRPSQAQAQAQGQAPARPTYR